MRVNWKACINQPDERCHDVTDVDRLGVVPFWDTKRWRWHHLLPAQAHVCAENSDGTKVEQAPSKRLEDFELHAVDVSHWNCRRCALACAVNPEKIQAKMEDGHDIDQVWRWADVRGSGSTKAELVQVNHHECQKGYT